MEPHTLGKAQALEVDAPVCRPPSKSNIHRTIHAEANLQNLADFVQLAMDG